MKRRILANMTKWDKNLVDNFKLLLKGGGAVEDLEYEQGKSCGALIVLKETAQRLGITKALGNDLQGRLALLQIIGRIVTQRSRLFLSRDWSNNQAVEEILDIDKFNEDDLYSNLHWLSDNQEEIENSLFDDKIEEIFLYDVTSSYFEGTDNELAEYGYNRDKKKGKKQIVIGLLCDKNGDPITIEVFKGNTNDTKTVSSQLLKLKERFGIKRMVFIGDKGMIKKSQIDELSDLKYHYITSITKKQIESLINNDVIQYDLFESEIVQIEHEEVKYILRRNPHRAKEIQENREEKIYTVETLTEEKNKYLLKHKKAKTSTALKLINEKITKLKLQSILTVNNNKKEITLSLNQEELHELTRLDGCYVIKTDLLDLDKKIAHDRYKDLAKVENAFRTLKTGLEEIRPIFVRKEKSTRGHVFICMLAYKIVKYLHDNTKDLDQTLRGIIQSLNSINYISYKLKDNIIKKLPNKLLNHQQDIIDALNIKLPNILYARKKYG